MYCCNSLYILPPDGLCRYTRTHGLPVLVAVGTGTGTISWVWVRYGYGSADAGKIWGIPINWT